MTDIKNMDNEKLLDEYAWSHHACESGNVRGGVNSPCARKYYAKQAILAALKAADELAEAGRKAQKYLGGLAMIEATRLEAGWAPFVDIEVLDGVTESLSAALAPYTDPVEDDGLTPEEDDFYQAMNDMRPQGE